MPKKWSRILFADKAAVFALAADHCFRCGDRMHLDTAFNRDRSARADCFCAEMPGGPCLCFPLAVSYGILTAFKHLLNSPIASWHCRSSTSNSSPSIPHPITRALIWSPRLFFSKSNSAGPSCRLRFQTSSPLSRASAAASASSWILQAHKPTVHRDAITDRMDMSSARWGKIPSHGRPIDHIMTLKNRDRFRSRCGVAARPEIKSRSTALAVKTISYEKMFSGMFVTRPIRARSDLI